MRRAEQINNRQTVASDWQELVFRPSACMSLFSIDYHLSSFLSIGHHLQIPSLPSKFVLLLL